MFFSQPFFSISVGSALRSFQNIVNDQSSIVYHHPADFKLYKVGSFDDSKGILNALVVPEFVASASEYSQKNRNGFVVSESQVSKKDSNENKSEEN